MIKNRVKKKCLRCNKEFWIIPSRKNKAKYCSKKCHNLSKKGQHISPKTEFKKGQKSLRKGKKFPQFAGKNSPSWKGGEFIRSGYVYVHQPNHPFAIKMGYVLKSHLVAEKCLGRYLVPEEMIHHIGVHYPIGSIENKGDDTLENLYVFPSRKKHNNYHFKKNRIQLKSNLTPNQ